MRNQKMSSKILLKVKPILNSGERAKVLDVASTLNPWIRVLSLLPLFLLFASTLSKGVNLLIMFTYLFLVVTSLRRSTRLLVFTDQRILVFALAGGVDARYTLLRELPKGPEPIGEFHGRWKRFDSLDQPLYIMRS